MNRHGLPARPAGPASSRLMHAVSAGDIFHAYMFEGDPGDTAELAAWFTAAALCERQDGNICGRCPSCRQIADGVSPFIIRVKTEAEKEAPDERFTKKTAGSPGKPKNKSRRKSTKSSGGGRIKDAQIEDVIVRSRRSSLSASRVFTVIERAETITERGQNRLLKTLEEPPEGITIILLTSNSDGLLDTIRSRCVRIRADRQASGTDIPGKPAFRKRAVETAAALIQGAPAFMLWKDIDYFSDKREYTSMFCEIAELFYRDMIVYADPASRQLTVLEEFRTDIEASLAKAGTEAACNAVQACLQAEKDIAANVSGKHTLRSLVFSIQLGMRARSDQIIT